MEEDESCEMQSAPAAVPPSQEEVQDGCLPKSPPPGLPIFTTANSKPLDIDTVVDILKNVDKYESIACDAIPPDPKAGNVFLYIPKSDSDKSRLDWTDV